MELNTISKTTLRRSEIHGIGVFAIRDIKKGEIVYAGRMPKVYSVPYESFGALLPEVRKIILERWPIVIHGARFLWPDVVLASFMNHAPTKESINYDPVTDTATKDILADEEILENYCTMKDAEKVYPWLTCQNKV